MNFFATRRTINLFPSSYAGHFGVVEDLSSFVCSAASADHFSAARLRSVKTQARTSKALYGMEVHTASHMQRENDANGQVWMCKVPECGHRSLKVVT
jgi:hypothetical protein